MDVVTGAFSYTGSYIARRLLEQGREVTTLSRAPAPEHPLARSVRTAPLDFADPAGLAEALRGAETFYNTYWVRFPHGDLTFERAIENTRALFSAAASAGARIVHVSVSNPSQDSPLPYFRAKAQLERELAETAPSYAVIRPTLIFGREDVLVNNIAWILRRFPFFLVPGTGRYRVQPVSAEDTAALAVEAGGSSDNMTLDAAGSETYAFEELVRMVADAIGSRARIVHARAGLALGLSKVVGWMCRDVVLTREELDGLMASLLVSAHPPRGKMSFLAWLRASAPTLGRKYVSELERNYRAPL